MKARARNRRGWTGGSPSAHSELTHAHACYACDLPVISASLGEVGSSVTMGALLCMLLICAWPVQLTVPAGGLSGSGCRWPMCIWSSWPGGARPNTVLAAAYDLKVFFTVVGKPPRGGPACRCAGVHHRAAHRPRLAGMACCSRLVRAAEPAGVSAATVRRRLSIVSGFFAFLQARGDVPANPVPRGLPTRRERSRPRQGVPLVRVTRRLPRILSPAEVDALTGALRTHRDRAMVAAMVLGGLRRCEVLGLRLEDLRAAERRVFIAEGKGGRQRLIPVSGRFFTAVGRLPRCRAAARCRHRPALRGAQGPAPRAAAVGQGHR